MTIRDPSIDPLTADTPSSALFTAPAPIPPRPTADQIAGRARALWEAQGCPVGRALENFRQAELELQRELNRLPN